MKNKVFILFLTISFFACGKVEHEVTGSTDVNFNFNLKEIESYFHALCQSNNDPNPELCAKAHTAEFLQYMMSLQEGKSQ